MIFSQNNELIKYFVLSNYSQLNIDNLSLKTKLKDDYFKGYFLETT